MNIPIVRVGDIFYQAKLNLLPTDPMQFKLSDARKVSAFAAEHLPVFSNGILVIPRITINGKDHLAELERVAVDPMIFQLLSLSPLEDSTVEPTDPTAYSVLPNGRGGFNYEPVWVNEDLGFDKQRSLAAFEDTLYKYLRSNTCIACHNSNIPSGSGAQAPLHADGDVTLAHDYALTRVNFSDPKNSKFVVRMAIDRHNCPFNDCAQAAENMLTAIENWKAAIADMLPETPRSVPASVIVTDTEIEQWIAEDRADQAPEDRDYIIYTSMHELHNEGLSADDLNIVRTGLSKALNSVARWAPEIVNPVDVNGQGLLYKFDIRDYWGWNKGVTRLLFGGSDDDLAFSNTPKLDYRGNVADASVQREVYNYADEISWDPEFSKVIWARVLHGNVEGANVRGATIPPYIDGFRGRRSRNAAGEYVAFEDFEWVETAQLIYTLTRPDVYNAIMMIPMDSNQLEEELGVDKSLGMDSYDYVISYDAITVDSRLLWRAQRKDGGWYWKTWDVFTGQIGRDRNIFDVYAEADDDIRFPWWANPIPVFVNPRFNFPDNGTWSFIASLAQPFAQNPNSIPAGCDPQPSFSGIDGFYNCKHFNGMGGGQQSASEIIWDLPNGLQGYMLTGAFNQRRVDAFANIVRDPRLIPDAEDDIATQTGFAFRKRDGGIGGFLDPRLNVGSSCIGCHIDGLNRINNDMRDWLDESPQRLPSGPYGVDPWINDEEQVARVKELYPPSELVRGYIESGRQTFLGAMARIKQGMIIGDDKNVYVEPVIWTVEYVQRQKYRYPQTTSN